MTQSFSIVKIETNNTHSLDIIMRWIKDHNLDLNHVGFTPKPKLLIFYFRNQTDAVIFKLAWA